MTRHRARTRPGESARAGWASWRSGKGGRRSGPSRDCCCSDTGRDVCCARRARLDGVRGPRQHVSGARRTALSTGRWRCCGGGHRPAGGRGERVYRHARGFHAAVRIRGDCRRRRGHAPGTALALSRGALRVSMVTRKGVILDCSPTTTSCGRRKLRIRHFLALANTPRGALGMIRLCVTPHNRIMPTTGRCGRMSAPTFAAS